MPDTHLNSKKDSPLSAHIPLVLQIAAGWAWRLLIIAATLALGGWLLLKFSTLLISLLAAILMTVLVEPIAAGARRKLHLPPAAGAALGLFAILFIIFGILGTSGTALYKGFSELGSNLEKGMQSIFSWINASFPGAQAELDNAWNSLQNAARGNSQHILGGVMAVGSSVTSFLTGAVLAFFALFFFLKDGRHIWHWFVRLAPPPYRDAINEAGIRGWVTIGNYMRTQVIVAFVDALGITIIALLLRTPITIALPIFALVFLGSFIPIIGAFLSGAIAVLIVLVNTGSPFMALLMFGGVILVQQVEGNLLQPLLQGNALNMHALAIVLLVTGGSAVAGVVGALFAVPIAAAINSAVLYLLGHDSFPYLQDNKNRPGGAPQPFSTYTELHWQQFNENAARQGAKKQQKLRKNSHKK